jgi:hypothetical protein
MDRWVGGWTNKDRDKLLPLYSCFLFKFKTTELLFKLTLSYIYVFFQPQILVSNNAYIIAYL